MAVTAILFCMLFLLKIIDLNGGQISYPSTCRILFSSVPLLSITLGFVSDHVQVFFSKHSALQGPLTLPSTLILDLQ